MLAFLDFEASSLSKNSYPIEVAWVFEDGASERHLIRPAPEWTDWDPGAEAMHHLSRAVLEAEGEPHAEVAHRVLEALSEHVVYASAPSWDGKWLSVLLRAGGLPRHAMRLKDSDEAHLEAAREALWAAGADGDLDELADGVVARVRASLEAAPPVHRALQDAEHERRVWREVRRVAGEVAAWRADAGGEERG
jgi:hypothetical protein